jgi:hypothetical protein
VHNSQSGRPTRSAVQHSSTLPPQLAKSAFLTVCHRYKLGFEKMQKQERQKHKEVKESNNKKVQNNAHFGSTVA